MAKYLSKVPSLVMHSFSIWLAIILESVLNMQFWTPIARNLRRPNITASYSAILLLHLSFFAVNCKRVAYLSLHYQKNSYRMRPISNGSRLESLLISFELISNGSSFEPLLIIPSSAAV
jgi:hypothetical protein